MPDASNGTLEDPGGTLVMLTDIASSHAANVLYNYISENTICFLGRSIETEALDRVNDCFVN